MAGPLVRRLRLPAAQTSPSVARRVVGELLSRAGLDRVRDAALLLTSEVVTNGVIHAGTDIELEAVVDALGIHVAVTDFAEPFATPLLIGVDGGGEAAPEPQPELAAGSEPAEGGRGLLLVSRFASVWGTTYDPGGRTVWFRLDTDSAGTEAYTGAAAAAAGAGAGAGAGARAASGATATPGATATDMTGAEWPQRGLDAMIDTVVGRGRTATDSISDLLTRLATGIGAATATITVDRAEGAGSEVVARYASQRPTHSMGRTLRVPLTLTRPWVGELTATGTLARHAAAVAALAAGQLALMVESQRLREAQAVADDPGRRAAVAVDNPRSNEGSSQTARTLQRPLLPLALPIIEGLEVAAEYVPAVAQFDVGGDFYDVVDLPRQGWMMVVGSVPGKGVGAGAAAGLVRDVLRAHVLDRYDPAHTLSRLNATLVERGGGHLCTLALAHLTRERTGSFILDLHLAGHGQPALLRADASTELVGVSGTALGVVDAVVAPHISVRMHHSDVLVLYTDGVTKRRRGRAVFDRERLCAEMATMAGSPASALASHLRSAVLSFSPEPPRDDIAIVAVRVV